MKWSQDAADVIQKLTDTGTPDLTFPGIGWERQIFDYRVENPKAAAVLTGIQGFNTACGFKNCLMLFGDRDGETKFLADVIDRWEDPWSEQVYGRVGPDVFMVDPNVKGKYEIDEVTSPYWKDIKYKAEGVNYFDHEAIMPLLKKKAESFTSSISKAVEEEITRRTILQEHQWAKKYAKNFVKKVSTSWTGS